MQDANDLGVNSPKKVQKQRQIARKSPNYKTKQLELQKSIIADVTALEAKVKAAPAS